jgi:hypothetical protein
MMTDHNPARWAKWLTGLLLLLIYVRLYFGVDMTDESQYVAQAYAPAIGGGAFQADLLIQQTPSLLIAPLVEAYRHFFGSEGLVLVLRHLYFLLTLLTSRLVYLFLKKQFNATQALLCSTLLVSFIPFCIPSWSYNNLTYLGLPASLILLLSPPSETRWSALAAGLFSAIVCFAYPPIVVVYIAIVTWIYFSKTGAPPISRGRFWTYFFSLLIGGLASIAYILSFGLERLHRVFELSSSFGELGGFDKMQWMLGQFWHGLSRGAFLPFFLLIFWARRTRLRPWLDQHSEDLLFALLGLCAFARMSKYHLLNYVLFGSLSLLVLYKYRVLNGRPFRSKNQFVFLSAGFFAAAILSYSSGNGLVNAGIGLILPLQILLLECLKPMPERKANWALAILAVFFCFKTFDFVYGDAPVTQLNSKIDSGPFKSMYTTAENKAFLSDAESELKRLAQTHRSLFAAHFTSAYLVTDIKPVTGLLFAHEEAFSQNQLKLIFYQSLELGTWPDFVISKTTKNSELNNQFTGFFLKSGRYQDPEEHPGYTILRKKNI